MSDVYAAPTYVEDVADCWFYHTIDLPGLGTVAADWDLRGGVDDYLGHVPLAGKRVLELGTASGFLAFEMEKRGAEVVAFDLAPGLAPDVLPLAGYADLAGLLAGYGAFYARLRNSFWLGHRLLNSRAKVVYGDIYHVPAAFGPVDVSTFGCILLHLRDPFLALASAARLTRETLVVTDRLHENEWLARLLPPAAPAPRRTLPERALRKARRLLVGPPVPPPPAPPALPAVVFLPDVGDPSLPTRSNSWWQFSPAAIQRMLGVLGFGDTTVTTHGQTFQKDYRLGMFTVVGRRTAPMPANPGGSYPWA